MKTAERILLRAKGELNHIFKLAEKLHKNIDIDYDNDRTLYQFGDKSVLVVCGDKVYILGSKQHG